MSNNDIKQEKLEETIITTIAKQTQQKISIPPKSWENLNENNFSRKNLEQLL